MKTGKKAKYLNHNYSHSQFVIQSEFVIYPKICFVKRELTILTTIRLRIYWQGQKVLAGHSGKAKSWVTKIKSNRHTSLVESRSKTPFGFQASRYRCRQIHLDNGKARHLHFKQNINFSHLNKTRIQVCHYCQLHYFLEVKTQIPVEQEWGEEIICCPQKNPDHISPKIYEHILVAGINHSSKESLEVVPQLPKGLGSAFNSCFNTWSHTRWQSSWKLSKLSTVQYSVLLFTPLATCMLENTWTSSLL